MSHPDQPQSNLPSSWPSAPPASPPALPAAAWDLGADPDAPQARRITPGIVWRAARRHWWQILLVWGIGSAGLMYLAHTRIKPLYSAVALLQVESPSKGILVPSTTNDRDINTWMETQVQLATSKDVLSLAASTPDVRDLPRIKAAADATEEIASLVKVFIPPRTQLIAISMNSESPAEGPIIVNALVDSYLERSHTLVDDDTQEKIKRLREMKARVEKDVRDKRDELKRLTISNPELGTGSDDKSPIFLAQYSGFKNRAVEIQLDIMEAEAAIAILEEKVMLRNRGTVDQSGGVQRDPIDQAVRDAFLADPTAHKLLENLKEVEDKAKAVDRIAAKGNDPALRRFRDQARSLRADYDALWAKMQPQLRRQFEVTPPSTSGIPEADDVEQALEAAKLRLAQRLKEKSSLDEEMEEVRGKVKLDNNAALLSQFTTRDLDSASDMLEKVSANLEQLELDARDKARITTVSRARPSGIPAVDNRLKLMAAAPVAMLALAIGLFLAVEICGARVVDPDDVPTRARLGVIGVVPPLPAMKAPRGPRALRDQRRRLEEFVQSLDHLRVTLCAAAGGEGHRCVMITSACGGEGKTTLAAQLAGRCANAGMRTLLVDADLRRPSLGVLLEVPEGPGLAEVLLGEATPESTMVIIGNAGGFHLLPAGAGGHDPSRLFQGERVGQLIARLREAFDIVIIDTPPVLPVADALLLGRWTDGAVLAVRHDVSRFPLIERARRRLQSVGLTILGAVVNGARPPEAGHGSYSGYYASEPALPA